MIRSLGLAVSCVVLALSATAQSPDPAGAAVIPRARAIHESAIIVDTHADTPQRFLDENYDIGSTDPKDPGHISLDKAKAGNLGAEFFSIWDSSGRAAASRMPDGSATRT